MRFGLARAPSGPGRTCASCRAEVIWAVTDNNHRMPVDSEQAPPALLPEARDGNLVLWFEVDPQGRPVGKQRVSFATAEQRKDATIPLWKSHFSTCPNASHHRRAAR